MRALLDQVSEKLATFSEVGISPAHADHIFSELTTYETRVCVSNAHNFDRMQTNRNDPTLGNLSLHAGPQEVLDRALSLANEGDSLIEASHYAEDSIRPKCSEVRAISENMRSRLQTQKDHLLKAMELHRCLERVRGQHTRSQCVVPALFVVYSAGLPYLSGPFRRPSGLMMVFTCWHPNRWTSVYRRMELS